MRDLATTAQRLRLVKNACDQFFALWAINAMAAKPRLLQRLQRDIEACDAEKALSDPQNHDWSLLYRGSILDD